MPVKITVMSLDFESSMPPHSQVFGKDEVTIGRFPENDLVLEGEDVSGAHAKLFLRNGDALTPII